MLLVMLLLLLGPRVAPPERFLRLQKGAKCVAWRSGGDRLELAGCEAGGYGNEQQFAALTYTGSAAPW